MDAAASPRLTMMYLSSASIIAGGKTSYVLRVDHGDELWMPTRFTAFGFDADGNAICGIYPARTVYPPGYCPPGIACPTSDTTECPSSPYSMSIYSYGP
jgi:hypothetical protein